jgi:hypothetical protein
MSGVFIQRRFDLADESEVLLRIYRPISDAPDFRCDYEIIWPNRKRVFHAVGIDEVQALILATRMAHLGNPDGTCGPALFTRGKAR